MTDSHDQKRRQQQPAVDHVARIVEQHYDVGGGELRIGGIAISQLAERFGTPAFIYDQQVIERRVDQVRRMLPARFQLFYSIKANPNSAILRFLLDRDCGLEVASGGELYQALHAHCPPERLIFAGPGKTEAELASAVQAGIREIHVESIEEARCLNALAHATGKVVRIALRVNPVDASGGAMRMGGRAAPFGIDEEDLPEILNMILSLPHLDVAGVHLFMGTQILHADTLMTQYRRALEIARDVARRIPGPLQTIDFGGGLGTPYFPHETEIDLEQVASGLATIDAEMEKDPLLAGAAGILEPGRFLVNEAGVYLAKVTRVKHSRGKTFAVIDGGMHHHLAASGNLGQTIKRNYPVAILNKIGVPPEQAVDVVGPLCTPLDVLARQVRFPHVEAGDLFGVFQSGAYARTSSPHGFLSHDAPAEIMVNGSAAELIRRRGHAEDYLRDQPAADARWNQSYDAAERQNSALVS